MVSGIAAARSRSPIHVNAQGPFVGATIKLAVRVAKRLGARPVRFVNTVRDLGFGIVEAAPPQCLPQPRFGQRGTDLAGALGCSRATSDQHALGMARDACAPAERTERPPARLPRPRAAPAAGASMALGETAPGCGREWGQPMSREAMGDIEGALVAYRRCLARDGAARKA
jgi:hypothetical protein